jgi:hypothetical protein
MRVKSTDIVLVFCRLDDATAVRRTLEKGGEYLVEAAENQSRFCFQLSTTSASGAQVGH